MGAQIEFNYRRLEPLTFNHTDDTNNDIIAARSLVGDASVDDGIKPLMVSEDFAYMLLAEPGTFIFLVTDPTAEFHNPEYDFDDGALPYRIGYSVILSKRLCRFEFVEASVSKPIGDARSCDLRLIGRSVACARSAGLRFWTIACLVCCLKPKAQA
ncbi:hypothetical protein SAMN05216525_15630 [Bradyrhizobium sp. Gha]|nr:amidohydrolase [Bradyrhizobium sp. Gha]SFK14700.1 hypothetical protein SAMN05216525_15630 [Bradyrhizobium sp. Gha]